MIRWLQPYWQCLLFATAVAEALNTTTTYANTTVPRGTLLSSSGSGSDSSTKVGDYIVQGLGGTTSSSTEQSDSTSSSGLSETSGSETSTQSPPFSLAHQNVSSTFLEPITTFSSADLSASFSYATNVTGITQAAQCWSELSRWSVSSVSWYNSVAANTTYPLTNTSVPYDDPWYSTTTLYPTNASTYTLCDGSPRADTSPLTIYSSGITTWFDTFLQPALPSSFSSQPCTPTPEECRIYYYDSNLYDPSANASVWDSFKNETRGDDDLDRAADDGLLRYCGFPAHLSEPCIIAGGPVELFYFPIETVGGDLCHGNASNASTIVNTNPAVVTTLGREYTSGSVYLSFSTLYASYDGFWDRVGPTYSDYVMTLKSEDISTHCGDGALGWDWGPATQVNFADWNKPLHADVYNCQKQCSSTAPCSTIWDNFNPWLAVPTVIKSMVPQWSTCTFNDEMEAPLLFDPPRALQQVSAEASVTMPSAHSSTQAAPSSTPTSPMPVETGPSSNTQSAATTSMADPGTSGPSSSSVAEPDPSPNTDGSSDGSSQGTPTALPDTEGSGVSPADPAQTPSDPTTQGNGDSPSDPSPHESSEQADPTATAANLGGAVASLFGSTSANGAGSVTHSSPGTGNTAASDPEDPTAENPGTTNALSVLESAAGVIADPGVSTAVADTGSQAGTAGADTDPSLQPTDALSTQGLVVQTAALGQSSIALTSVSGHVEVGSQTLSVGGPAQTVAGHVLSAGSSGVVIDGSTPITFAVDPIATSDLTAATLVTVGSQQYTISSAADRGLLVNGVTVSPGGSAVEVDGQTFSAMGSALVAGSTTIDMEGLTTATDPSSAMAVAGTTLSVGGPDVVSDGNTYSLASSGLVLVNAQTTQLFSAVQGTSQSLTGGASLLAAGSVTLTAAAAAASAGSGDQHTSGAQVAVGSHTFSIAQDPASANVDVVDGSVTLTVGGSAQTVAGQTFSAASDGILVDGSTVALTAPASSGSGAQQTAHASDASVSQVDAASSSSEPSTASSAASCNAFRSPDAIIGVLVFAGFCLML